MKALRYVFEALITFVIYGFFRVLPLDAASATGGWIMRTVGPWLGLSARARQNIQIAFPEKSQAERDKILVGMWDNLGRVAGEYPHLHHIWSRVELAPDAAQILKSLRDDQKPGIVVAGHLANWEICSISAKQLGLDLNVVYRKPNNPWVDGLLRYARAAGASGQIRKGRGGAREILSVLKAGGHVGVMVDQKLNEGVAVPFFGHDAMTADAIAQFALKFECPLVPFRVERLHGARFRITSAPPVAVVKTGDADADIKKILLDINLLIEKWVRENPAQWLWLHRRWPDKLYID